MILPASETFALPCADVYNYMSSLRRRPAFSLIKASKRCYHYNTKAVRTYAAHIQHHGGVSPLVNGTALLYQLNQEQMMQILHAMTYLALWD